MKCLNKIVINALKCTAILLFIFFNKTLIAQDKFIDSLKNELKFTNSDSIKCILLNDLIENSDDDKWPKFNDQLKEISEKYINSINTIQKKYFLNYYGKSLNNLGYYFDTKGNINKALEFYNKSLKIQERLGNKPEIAELENNLAYIYEHQGDNKKALELYTSSYKILIESNKIKESTSPLNNMGILYGRLGNKTKALDCYTLSLKMNEEIGNKKGISQSYKNIGSYYVSIGDFNTALKYANLSLIINKEIKDNDGLLWSYGLIGEVYYSKKDYNNALKFTLECFELSKKQGFPENIKSVSKQLYSIYLAKSDYKNALNSYKMFISIRDSLNNENTKNAAIKSQYQIQYEKQALQDSLAYAKEKQIKNIELDKQKAEVKAKRSQQYILYGGLFVVIVFAGFIFNRFKKTQKQKQIIELKEIETEKQKRIIEEKHNEIEESIQYSREIQNKFLKLPQILPNYINKLHLIYKPKDVLSGDFYWYKDINDLLFIVVGDCTGHGVSGSIISVLAIQSFEKKIQEIKNGTQLNDINKMIKTEFDQFYTESERVYIGLEYSIICFDKLNNKLFLTGSGASVLIKDTNQTVIQERFSSLNIGGSTLPEGENKLIELNLNDIDSIYLYTDGLVDQKGEERGKKFGTNRFKDYISKNKDITEFENDLLKWKGNMNQIDDITFLGIYLNKNKI